MQWLIPESLFGRLMTAMLAAVVVGALVIGLLVARDRSDLAFWRSEAADVVRIITRTSSELVAAEPSERAAVIAALREHPLAMDRSEALSWQARPQDLATLAREYQARLQRELGGGYRVTVGLARPGRDNVILLDPDAPSLPPAAEGEDDQPRVRVRPEGLSELPPFLERGRESPAVAMSDGAGGQLLIRAPGDAGSWLGWLLDVGVDLPGGETVFFRTAAPRPAPPMPPRIFLELGALTVLLGAVLFVMARSITHPLSDLSRAADAMGRGVRVAPLRERGSRELREATRAFNAMQERLHRYLDSRTRVLAAMSHDLRTPLTRLRLRAESIGDEGQRDRFVADFDEMDRMVRDALDLFRGLNEDEELSDVDVAAVLAELQAEFAEIGAKVAVEGTAARSIRARPHAIKRCLQNLLSNAIKFGTSATVVMEDGHDLVLRVRDEGSGIPEHALEQVFEPFFRLEGSRNPETAGTGLGLSIARDIAQAHGGMLVLRNRAAGGLEAVLTLPRTCGAGSERNH